MYLNLLSLMILSLLIPNLFFMWMFLEISSMLYTIYLNINSLKIYSIMYFMISSMTSILIIYSFLNKTFNLYINFILLFSLWLKLGLYPLNSWMNFLMKKINFNSLILLLTIIKCIPIFMFLNFIKFNFIILFMLIFFMLPPVIFSMNISSFTLLMNYSSMYNIPLLLIFSYLNFNIMIIYMTIYMTSTLMILLMLKKLNLYYKNSLNLSLNYKNKMFYNLMMFKYSQLPPFLPFIIKWNLINLMLSNNYMIMLSMLIIFSSLLMTFNYLNFNNNNFFLTNSKISHKINLFDSSNLNIMFIMYFSFLTFTLIFTFSFMS
uniref:NADH-ubiquinone oxidoreductase chain 2 n=1 Tax=Halictus rubicundus TaxID=77578 RepID=A0A0S2LTQ9_HALRI|nr:NADH dehydrogenase subunit 2 [Halictus rubicundus]